MARSTSLTKAREGVAPNGDAETSGDEAITRRCIESMSIVETIMHMMIGWKARGEGIVWLLGPVA